MKTYSLVVYRVVFAMVLSHTTTANISEAKNLPEVNLQAVHSHQKELIGKRRALASLNERKETSSINKTLSQVVFEETQTSLPTEFKSQAKIIAKTIIEEANKYEMDPLFIIAVIKHESYFNPTTVGSFKEIGLMQIKPSTAEWLNKKVGLESTDLYNPVINIKLGTAFFGQLRDKFEKDSRLYISAYNMGPANVRKLLRNNKKPKDYAAKVMKNYVALVETLEVALLKEPFPMKVAKN